MGHLQGTGSSEIAATNLRCRPLHSSPDGLSLASGAASDPVIIIWDLSASRSRLRLELSDRTVRALAFSPDSALLASACGRVPRVQLCDTITGRRQRRFSEDLPATHVAFSANGEFLATADLNGTIRLWSVATGEARSILTTQPAWIDTLAVSSSGRHLAVSGNNGDFCLWNLNRIWGSEPEQ